MYATVYILCVTTIIKISKIRPTLIFNSNKEIYIVSYLMRLVDYLDHSFINLLFACLDSFILLTLSTHQLLYK